MKSEEKLRVLLTGHAAFSERDVDGVIRIYAPDCEYMVQPSAEAMVGAGAIGHDALRAMLRVYFEAVSSLKLEILEAKIGAEGVLLTRERGSMVSAVVGVELSQGTWHATEFRDGLILRRTDFEGPPPGWDEAEPVALPRLEA
jgi:ketosteroid isomerase-like protein